MKYKVRIPCKYVQGYLQGGYLFGEIDADSAKDAMRMLKDDPEEYCVASIQRYEIEKYELDWDKIEIVEEPMKEIKEPLDPIIRVIIAIIICGLVMMFAIKAIADYMHLQWLSVTAPIWGPVLVIVIIPFFKDIIK